MGKRINREKREVMEIASEREETVVNIEETRLNQENKFKYLCVVLRKKEDNRTRMGILYPLLKERGLPT